MNTLSTLAKGSLKNNKSKSILIILTILLTATLLTSVSLTCLNWFNANKGMTIERSGSFHGVYKRVNINDVNILKNNIDIESIGVFKTVGYSSFKENNLSIVYTDNNTNNMGNVRLIKGSRPTKKNEIAIQEGYLNLLDINSRIGEKVSLEYESKEDGKIKKYNFILSGIIKDSEINKANKNYTSIISEDFLKSEESSKEMKFNAYVRVLGENKLSGDEIKEKLKSVANDVGINKYNVKVNDDYINATNPDSTVIGFGVVIILIIIFSSVIVIYSIFYVSVVNKVKEYGKLRAVGATKKQIRKIILKEGFTLATISIPIGIIIGYLISNLIIVKIIGLDRYGVLGINIPVIIGILIISYITVFVSLIKPMNIAAKVSPVEAMRYSGDYNNKKQRKGYETINLKRLAYANISRNKKRTVITLASLSLSGILFITISTVMSSINAKDMATQHSSGDFTLALTNYSLDKNSGTTLEMLQEKNTLGKELQDKISKIDGVKEVDISRSTSAKYILPSGEESSVSFGGYEESMFKELEENLVEGEINRESLLSGKGIIYTYPNFAEEYGIKVGDKIKLSIYDGSRVINKEFNIEAISAVYGNEFIVPNKILNKIIKTDLTTSVGITVSKSKMESVKEELKSIADSNGFIEMTTLEEIIKQYEQAIEMTKILGYSLVIIIGVIGFINLINTMITSIITRKKELGILQAIGLSDKQLIRMLQIEGAFYTTVTLVVTLTLGNVIGYGAFLAFKNSGASYASYNYPLNQTIIMIVSVVLVQILITYLVTNNFKKDSLIDRIRYSE